jgi:hypothetical protein
LTARRRVVVVVIETVLDARDADAARWEDRTFRPPRTEGDDGARRARETSRAVARGTAAGRTRDIEGSAAGGAPRRSARPRARRRGAGGQRSAIATKLYPPACDRWQSEIAIDRMARSIGGWFQLTDGSRFIGAR